MWAILLGVALDYCLGEPKRFHPLVGFGSVASFLENRLNRNTYFSGFIAWAILVLPCVGLAFLVGGNLLLDSLIVYLAVAYKSLGQHANAILNPLLSSDIALARLQLQKIVSRDVQHLDATGVSKACVESVLENGSDSTFAAIFWMLVAGAPGIVLYRAANTLDAMWGYRNERYTRFGMVSAKVDDALNYIPARLVALSYALMGNFSTAIKCWREQAPSCDSPNAGPVMSVGAGALGISLGGSYQHGNKHYQKPVLGLGPSAIASDIKRALQLLNKTLVLWLLLIVLITVSQSG